MRLSLNLIEKPRKNHHALINWLLFGFLLIAACGLAAYPNIRLHRELSAKLANLKKQLLAESVAPSAQTPGESFEPVELNKLKEKVDFINRLWQQRRFYWTGFLNHLERETPADVMLLSITPDPASSKVKIEGLAKSTEDIVTMIKRMQASPYFREVFLSKQEKFNYQVGPNVKKVV